MTVTDTNRSGFRLLGLLLVILLLTGAIALLMPSLHSARQLALKQSLESRDAYSVQAPLAVASETPGGMKAPPRKLAVVKTFVATIDLLPGLSVGTERPESIYEARFTAAITAVSPEAARVDSELVLPLPPKLISLSDLTVTVNGEPNEAVEIRDDNLVCRAQLDAEKPTKINVTYTAVGNGIYTLNIPPGRIIDTFEMTLTANRSDIRMMQLSLQPATFERQGGKTVYTWRFRRLMQGRPIALDVLGVAPMDRLGEVVWLGPISVLVFGLLVTLVTLAHRPEKLDKWMLLLIVGTFAGAYPLMYFAQEYMSLTVAVIAACAVVLAVIGARAVTLFGARMGLFGVVLLAAGTFACTMAASIWTGAQGIILTIMAIGAFVVAMTQLPKAQKAAGLSAPPPPPVVRL